MKRFANDVARRKLRAGGEVFALTILAGMISSAYAQDGTPAAEAQAEPATAAAPAKAEGKDKDKDKDKDKEFVPTVNVTGFRSSLALSAAEKRDNIGLSDTVFSEDIGEAGID